MSAAKCIDCAYSEKVTTPQDLRGRLECRAEPPRVVGVTIGNGQGFAIVPAAVFPTIRPEWFCSKYAAKLVAVS